MYTATLFVAYADTFAKGGHKYYSGRGLAMSRSIAKAIRLAEKEADANSGGAQYTPILRQVTVVNSRTGKKIMATL